MVGLDIEMPESCTVCRYAERGTDSYSEDFYKCCLLPLSSPRRLYCGKPSNCPLKEISYYKDKKTVKIDEMWMGSDGTLYISATGFIYNAAHKVELINSSNTDEPTTKIFALKDNRHNTESKELILDIVKMLLEEADNSDD